MVLDPEFGQDVIELIHEELDSPKFFWLVRQMGRCPDAYLVVKDDGDAMGSVDLGVGEHVVVRHAWSAVKQDEGSGTRLEVADDLVPCLVRLVADVEVERACRFDHW